MVTYHLDIKEKQKKLYFKWQKLFKSKDLAKSVSERVMQLVEKDVSEIEKENSLIRKGIDKINPFSKKKDGVVDSPVGKSFLFFIAIVLPIFLIATPIVTAGLTITPNSIIDSVYVGNEKTGSLIIVNNNSFTIYDLRFSHNDLINFSGINELPPGAMGNIDYKIKTTQAGTQNFNMDISYYYFTDISNQPVFREVNITTQGFTPQHLKLTQGSQIKWNNLDNVAHSVTCSLFDATIQPGSSYQYTFSNIAYTDYSDTYIGYHGYINITSSTTSEWTHNPDLDISFNVNLNSLYTTTNLTVEMIDSNFTLNHNGTQDGLLKINNLGSDLARSLYLTSNTPWISFNKNNFSLDGSQSTYVTYTIAPTILYANETGQTYSKSIFINGLNTPPISGSIIIKINPANISELQDLSYDELLRIRNELLDILNNLNIPNSTSNIVYRDSEFPVNYTQADVYNMKRDYALLASEASTTNNQLKILQDNYAMINLVLANMSYAYNEQVRLNAEQAGILEDYDSSQWIIAGIILLIVSLTIIGIFVFKKARTKGLMGDEDL